MAGVDWESLTEATSGAVGALVSSTVLYPLDTCKTRYQAEVRSHGQQKYRLSFKEPCSVPSKRVEGSGKRTSAHVLAKETNKWFSHQYGPDLWLRRYPGVNEQDVLWEAISTRRVLSLYQGLGTKNLQSFISQFVYFYGYSYFRRLYLERSGAKSVGTKPNLVVAAAAGVCTVIITQPLDTASSRMQTSAFGKSKGLFKTLSEGSWSDAYDGLGVSLLLTSNPAIQYTVFDQLKRRLLKRRQSNKIAPATAKSSPEALSAFSAFVLGAISKSVATILTYPAIRCKVMIQASDSHDGSNKDGPSGPPKTMIDALLAIWRKEGIPGFFKGLQAQILKTVLSSALLLMIKEKISRYTWISMLALRRYLLVSQRRIKST